MATTIQGVIESYKQVIDGTDINLALAREVWAVGEEISFIHPRGHERGWTAVETGFYVGTMGLLSKRRLEVFDLSVHEYGDHAWVEFCWSFDATFKLDGSPLHTDGRETQILRRSDGDWRIVHVHYSGVPGTGEREGF